MKAPKQVDCIMQQPSPSPEQQALMNVSHSGLQQQQGENGAPRGPGAMLPPARKRTEDSWVLPRRGVQQALKAAGLDKDFKLEVRAQTAKID